MGYCMTQRDASFSIPREKYEDAIKHLRTLMTEEGKMSGGRFARGGCEARWFSWVDTKEAIAQLDKEDLQGFLWQWRWEAEEDETGITSIMFHGEKLGDDDHLWAALAPFVTEGSTIDMEGEDGTLWRWSFEGGEVHEKAGRVVFE